MQKEIHFSGIAAIPDDYQAPDGQLDIAYNLIHEDNHLTPLLQPHVVATLPAGCDIVFVHTTANFTHYIVRHADTLYWIDKEQATGTVTLSTDNLIHSFPTTDDNVSDGDNVVSPIDDTTTTDTTAAVTILSFNAIGNTLIVATSNGMHYFLWRLQPNGYNYAYLGNHIPELPLSFGLQGECKMGQEFLVDIGLFAFSEAQILDYVFDTTSIVDSQLSSYKAVMTKVNDTVMTKAIQFIAEHGTKKGRFAMPFFVRYAYRLYDGALVMHSAPVLMITDSSTAPHAFINGMNTNGEGSNGGVSSFLVESIRAQMGAIFCDLDYRCLLDTTELDAIRTQWGDVVKSVEVFVSAPLYRFNQSGEVQGWHTVPYADGGYTISKKIVDDNMSALYQKDYVVPLLFNTSYNATASFREFILPSFSDEAFCLSVKDACNFYLVKSINIEDIATSRTKIDVSPDLLSSLQTREVMSDDYDSHDTLIPNFLYTYNQRLNLAGINKLLSTPTQPVSYTAFCESNLVDLPPYYNPAAITQYVATHAKYQLFVIIKTDDGEKVVKSVEYEGGTGKMLNLPFPFLYYHNTNAHKAILKIQYSNDLDASDGVTYDDDKVYYYLLPLTPHNFLNGAVFFDTFSPSLQQLTDNSTEVKMITASTLPPALVALPNKIYTSEVNNPFLLPVTGINTVGAGTILGIASAARPLSQGQFGQFPLYAFCSDGIWALQVSDTGTYTAVQPIARDVCSDPLSITQLDSSVLFATTRGIMQIAGSAVQCLTDSIATGYPLSGSSLPRLTDIYNQLPSIAPFSSFLQGVRLLYDYIHQRIVLFNPSRERTQSGTKWVSEVVGFNKLTGEPIIEMHQVPLYTEGNYRYHYAYVLSLKSNQWGMMATDLKATINAYPDALAMTNGGKLVSFSTSDSTTADCLAVTRPLKLDDPDTFKSVRSLIQHGSFDNGDVKTALYASRNLHNWHLIATANSHKLRNLLGTPYKYFRLVTLAPNLSPDKNIAGISVEYTPKQTNQLR